MIEEWALSRRIADAHETAGRHGFELKIGRRDGVDLVPQKSPYVQGVTLREFKTFADCLLFLDGYAQKEFEYKNTIVAGAVESAPGGDI